MKFSKVITSILILFVGFLLGNNLSLFGNKSDRIEAQNQDGISENENKEILNSSFEEGDTREDSAKSSVSEKKAIKDQNLNNAEKHVVGLFEDAAPSVVFITTSTLRQSYYSFDVTEIPKGSGTGFMLLKKTWQF